LLEVQRARYAVTRGLERNVGELRDAPSRS
jgi:hypothetical protein